MIKILMTKDVPYIWDADDWLKLRKNHRIIGCFDGAHGEGWTRSVHANLPFKLTTIEARYLVTAGVAKAFEIPQLYELHQPVSEEKYEERLKMQEAKHFQLQKEKKRKEIEATVDRIIEGKKRKGKDVPLDREDVIQEELNRFTELPTKMARFDLCDPWIQEGDFIPYNFPEFSSELEQMRYQVYTDFHSKMKYYLTTGVKFGGDFIAYPGDPLDYHAEYIIMCEGANRRISNTHLLSQYRLATTLKKKLIVAKMDAATAKISYHHISRPHLQENT